MKSKSLLILAPAMLFAQAVLAGGSTPLQCTSTSNNVAKASHFYVAGVVGYAQSPWDEIVGGDHGAISISLPKNGAGGFTWGGSIGYQYQSWLGIELGAFNLPVVTMKITVPHSNISGDISTYIVYLAAKLSHPLTSHLTLFSKFGVGYQNLTADKVLDQGTEGIHSNSNFGPYFAAGLSYQFMRNLSVSLQFARAAGQSVHGADEDKYSTNPNFYTAGLQYSFK